MLYGDTLTPSQTSIEALKSLHSGPQKAVVRYTGHDSAINDTSLSTLRISASFDPETKIVSPYDRQLFRIYKNKVWEIYQPITLVDWNAYTVSLGYQMDPFSYLEYLRLIDSAGPNPKVEWDTQAKAWRDRATGEVSLAKYPVWVVDRFREVVISYALGSTFEILDVTTINDPDMLLWAYKRAINKLPEIKSAISEQSIVTLRYDKIAVLENATTNNAVITKVSVEIDKELQKVLKGVADDAATLIRQNYDKLAVATMKAADTAQVVSPTFSTDFSAQPMLSKIELTNTSDSVTENSIPSEQMKKSSIAVPIAVGVAAITAVVAMR